MDFATIDPIIYLYLLTIPGVFELLSISLFDGILFAASTIAKSFIEFKKKNSPKTNKM